MSKTKVCTKCKEPKKLYEFYKDNIRKDRRNPWCIKCVKKYYKDNKEKILEKSKNYYEKNREKIKETVQNYQKKNREKIKNRQRIYNKKNKRKLNSDRKKKYNLDPNFKIRNNLRTRLNKVLRGKTKSKATLKLLGCSIKFLKNHLESQFKPGMDWNNHGVHGWHIDHIKPCDKFDLTKESEQIRCFNYKNLQPLWAIDNLRKGDNY